MIFEIVFSLLTLIVLIALLKEYSSIRALQFYRKQGYKTIYKPFFGFGWFLNADKPNQDQLTRLSNVVLEGLENGERAVVFNSGLDTHPIILLLDQSTIREFFKKEVHFTNRSPVANGLYIGFSDDDGDLAMKKRNIIHSFFGYKNSKKLRQTIYDITSEHLTAFADKHWSEEDSSEWKKVDLKDFTERAVSVLTDRIVIGEDEVIKVGDELAVDLFTKLVDDLSATKSNPLNALSFGLLARWKLTPTLRKSHSKFKRGLKKVESIYMRRKEENPTEAQKSTLVNMLIDIMDEMPTEEEWSLEALVTEIAATTVVASDLNGTTLNAFV